jgi:hypothetical protein
MKTYGLNGFTHEPIGPQTSNDLGPINEPKSAHISHYWPHPKNFQKFGRNFLQQLVSSIFIRKTKISKYQQKKNHILIKQQ